MRTITSWLCAAAVAALTPSLAAAHCDTLDGPVVGAARAALETGAIGPVLAWVRPTDEREIRAAFDSARAVRKGGKEARELADRWFFETVVRVHRAGEGAPFDGLKAGGDPDPLIALADRAAATRDATKLEETLVAAVRGGLHAQLARMSRERPPSQDVAAGRRWVAAYVPFVHWVEAVHSAASSGVSAGADHGELVDAPHRGAAPEHRH